MKNLSRRRFVLAKQKMTMTGKKFCLFMFFGIFATHLVYLGELSQIKYTAVKNKSLHYSQWRDQYLHHDANQSEIFRNRTKIVGSYYYKAGNQPPDVTRKKPITAITKVLLVTSNPRSGSSYTGELLTAMPNVSYFFEPLWFLSRSNKSQEPSVTEKIGFVAKLLNCRYRGMRRVINSMKAREFVFKKPKLGSINLKTLPLLAKNSFISSIETECQRNPLRMTKLFRLRISDILPYMQVENSALGSDFKVILLQRDPRATINSLSEELQEWLPGATSPQKICGKILHDYTTVMNVKDENIRQRIMLMKYEDLVSQPKEMAVKLYRFINASEDIDYALQYLESHYKNDQPTSNVVAHTLAKSALTMSMAKKKIRMETKWRRGQMTKNEFDKFKKNSSYIPTENTDREREKRLKKYYGTHRYKSFKHDHWRETLSLKSLQEINSNSDCQKVLRLLSYKP